LEKWVALSRKGHTCKNGSLMEKQGSCWEKWIILAKRVKPVKMGYALKKNGSHLEKCASFGKMGYSWKKGSNV